MSLRELQSVEGFKVWNEFGSVEFQGKTDLTDLDLADLITIDSKGVEVYDDTRHNKPEVGKKLNKPATIVLNNVKPRRNKSASAFEESLIKQLNSQDGAEHLFYDPIKFIW